MTRPHDDYTAERVQRLLPSSDDDLHSRASDDTELLKKSLPNEPEVSSRGQVWHHRGTAGEAHTTMQANRSRDAQASLKALDMLQQGLLYQRRPPLAADWAHIKTPTVLRQTYASKPLNLLKQDKLSERGLTAILGV